MVEGGFPNVDDTVIGPRDDHVAVVRKLCATEAERTVRLPCHHGFTLTGIQIPNT